ncbi:MAG: hypothetical protein KGR47_15625, partial [Acidobacteria bacterium]|nr:hypothetical protein [Acidobacteriota bacterium]
MCQTSADCNDDDPCTDDACDLGACVHAERDEEPPAGEQVAGDCKRIVCAAGVAQEQADDTDLPVTTSDCDEEVCTNGTPSNPPLPADTACTANGGSFCDGNGACAQCLEVSDCAGIPESVLPPNSECGVRTCDAGTCSFAKSNNTGDEVNPVQGDCAKSVCDEGGRIAELPDSADAADDGNQCTTDTCVGMVTEHAPVADFTACGVRGDLVCVGGNCQCTQDSQCPTGETVDDPLGVCRTPKCDLATGCTFDFAPDGTPLAGAQQTDGNCKLRVCNGSGMVISQPDAGDVNDDGNMCTSDTCEGSVPLQTPIVGLPCVDRLNGPGVCSGQGECVECNTTSECHDLYGTVCATPSCDENTCTPNFVPQSGAALNGQVLGDCKLLVCDGSGNLGGTKDLPSDLPLADANTCTIEGCNGGQPAVTNAASGTACSVSGGDFCKEGACLNKNGDA